MDKTTFTASRILVPVDGSSLAEQAIPFAVRMGGPRVTLHLVRVVPYPEAIRSFWGTVVATEAQMESMICEDALHDLDRAAQLVPDGIAFTKEIVSGDPADQIIQSAIRYEAGLIAMASHGRGAIGRWTFGSVADRVARESLLPVMIVCPVSGHHDAPSIERVIVPLDGSDLANHALPVAREIAQALRIPVHLVRCISPSSARYSTLETIMPVSSEAHWSPIHDEWNNAIHMLESASRALQATGIEVTTQLPIGPTVAGIEAALEPGDVVIITSHGRGGIRRWLLGSVAEQLIRDGLAPVLLVPSAERQLIARPAVLEKFAFAAGSAD